MAETRETAMENVRLSAQPVPGPIRAMLSMYQNQGKSGGSIAPSANEQTERDGSGGGTKELSAEQSPCILMPHYGVTGAPCHEVGAEGVNRVGQKRI